DGSSAEQEAKLAQARAALAEAPSDPERIIWVGRRLGYLWRMNEAIEVYSAGIEARPQCAPLYRHRGHRLISVRRFDQAVADLTRAAELIRSQPDKSELDGVPNARNIPLTTTAFNVWYHLGLARYLTGDFEGALSAYEETMKYAQRYDDNLVASSYWKYLTLRRLGRAEEAAALLEPITPQMEIIENHAYHRLLLFYRGLIKPDELLDPSSAGSVDFATLGFGAGIRWLSDGATARAREMFERVVETDEWPAFGFIAAEVELVRLRGRE
ncbi:MAG: tetratricopeptide repeat protein, partial [Planctomycetota bacterium]